MESWATLEIAAYLQEQLGLRMAAHLAGLADTRQIGRYAKDGGPEPSAATERRLREGYKVVRMRVDAYDPWNGEGLAVRNEHAPGR